MVRRSPFAALALVAACSPLSESVDGSRLDEGETFVVPEGERWEGHAFGLDSDSIGAVMPKENGLTRLTLWPGHDGSRVELAKRIQVEAGQSVEVVGGSSMEADTHCVLRRATKSAPRVGSGSHATAETNPDLFAFHRGTRVARSDTGEFARASAWHIAGLGYSESGPLCDVIRRAFWDDGLVLFRVDAGVAHGECEVGRVASKQVVELARRWRAFVVEPLSKNIGAVKFLVTEPRR